jgi:hypothetical protein
MFLFIFSNGTVMKSDIPASGFFDSTLFQYISLGFTKQQKLAEHK